MSDSARGGAVAGSVKTPFNATDDCSFLIAAQASGAGVLASTRSAARTPR
ncbi:MAG: hypothetical protein P4L90_16050 [Rhodopila sp.]|nr:hypothetical protein [Rhodopila sp.]